jgi:hypothetical protein
MPLADLDDDGDGGSRRKTRLVVWRDRDQDRRSSTAELT